jgi:hypothetical protein
VFVEYKIKFERDGFTLTQRVESGAEDLPVVPDDSSDQKLLARTFDESQASSTALGKTGGAPVDRPKGAGGNPGSLASGSVTIIGPFILLQPQSQLPRTESDNGRED